MHTSKLNFTFDDIKEPASITAGIIMPDDVGLRPFAKVKPLVRARDQTAQCLGQRGLISSRNEQTGLAITHDFRNGGYAGADCRQSGGCRFRQYHRQAVTKRWQGKDVGLMVQRFKRRAIRLHTVVDKDPFFCWHVIFCHKMQLNAKWAESAEGFKQQQAAFSFQIGPYEEIFTGPSWRVRGAGRCHSYTFTPGGMTVILSAGTP